SDACYVEKARGPRLAADRAEFGRSIMFRQRSSNSSRARSCPRAATAALLATLATASAQAQSMADFYRGRTITLSVGLTAGGGYDLHARVLARHLGRHIPGNPAIVVKNAPGAAGLALMNTLYNSTARDGTEIATFDRGIPLEPLFESPGARFD